MCVGVCVQYMGGVGWAPRASFSISGFSTQFWDVKFFTLPARPWDAHRLSVKYIGHAFYAM